METIAKFNIFDIMNKKPTGESTENTMNNYFDKFHIGTYYFQKNARTEQGVKDLSESGIDLVFCIDTLLYCKKIVCLPNVFYNYILGNTTSLSHRYKEGGLDMLKILEGKISSYIKELGCGFASAKVSLNNLMIYIAYECVKNEARHVKRYAKIKNLLHDEAFHNAVCLYKATGFKYKIVQNLMRAKQVRLLIAYIKLTRKA
jgi:hypothetical protein